MGVSYMCSRWSQGEQTVPYAENNYAYFPGTEKGGVGETARLRGGLGRLNTLRVANASIETVLHYYGGSFKSECWGVHRLK